MNWNRFLGITWLSLGGLMLSDTIADRIRLGDVMSDSSVAVFAGGVIAVIIGAVFLSRKS